MANAKILIVEDEPSISNLVASYLRKEGYEVQISTNGTDGLQAALSFRPDLVVLDIMLPGMDGLELLTRLRRESDVYVILLTAKTEETDRVVGLSVGADDYVTKPFSPRELTARVKAALRRLQGNTGQSGTLLVYWHIRIDIASRQVWVDDQPVELTVNEFDLLRTLAEHRGIVLSREQLLEKTWGANYFGEIRVVDVHISHLRQKLEQAGSCITTVRGVGYRFDDERV